MMEYGIIVNWYAKLHNLRLAGLVQLVAGIYYLCNRRKDLDQIVVVGDADLGVAIP